MELTAAEVIRAAVEAAESRKAADIVALDLKGISSVTDCFIVCSGSSDRNVRAIADEIQVKLKERGRRPLGVEGHREGTWVLMDYVDVVIHIFHHEKRAAFALEELWKDAPRIQLETAAAAAKEGS